MFTDKKCLYVFEDFNFDYKCDHHLKVKNTMFVLDSFLSVSSYHVSAVK